MASTTSNTIVIRVNGADRPVFDAQDALPANEAITPGELLSIDNDEELIPHGSANGVVSPIIVAIEQPYTDNPAQKSIDHDYATGESVRFVIPQPGDIILAWIEASASLVKGQTRLGSAGDGALQAVTVDATIVEGAVIAVAWEDATVGGGGRERKKVMII